MGTYVLKNAKLWVDKYDMSGDHRSLNLLYGAEPVDFTAFGANTRTRKGGLKTIALNGNGFWSGGTGLSDDALFAAIGVADTPVSISPAGGAVGEPAYLWRALVAKYAPQGQIGGAFEFTVDAESARGEHLARGNVLENGTKTVTGTGTKVQVGAATASQTIVSALHVFTVAGTNPTLDVIVQSDADASAGGETSRITFAQATGKTSEFKTLAGAVTDTHWRVSYTIGGTGGPSFAFVVTLGIVNNA